MTVFIQGLLLGLAYVAPIGTQNLYVIQASIHSNMRRAIRVALITIFFDITLAISCFYGIGLVIEKSKLFQSFMYLFGSLTIILIGFNLIKTRPEIIKKGSSAITLKNIAITCFIVTWLNPQAIIDGSMLLGGYRAALSINNTYFFIIGIILASFLWFISLASITSIFKKSFNPFVLRIINIVCGAIILFYGLRLGYGFILSNVNMLLFKL